MKEIYEANHGRWPVYMKTTKKQEHFAQKQNFQIDNDVLAVGKIKAPKQKPSLFRMQITVYDNLVWLVRCVFFVKQFCN